MRTLSDFSSLFIGLPMSKMEPCESFMNNPG
jgi:hypothetical protein